MCYETYDRLLWARAARKRAARQREEPKPEVRDAPAPVAQDKVEEREKEPA